MYRAWRLTHSNTWLTRLTRSVSPCAAPPISFFIRARARVAGAWQTRRQFCWCASPLISPQQNCNHHSQWSTITSTTLSHLSNPSVCSTPTICTNPTVHSNPTNTTDTLYLYLTQITQLTLRLATTCPSSDHHNFSLCLSLLPHYSDTTNDWHNWPCTSDAPRNIYSLTTQ